MIVLVIGGIIIFGIGYFVLKKYWREYLRRNTKEWEGICKSIEEEFEKDKKYLPCEEDISEEMNEAEGIESSAVMDEEDEEI